MSVAASFFVESSLQSEPQISSLRVTLVPPVSLQAYGDFIRDTRVKLLKVDTKDRRKISKQLLARNVLRENILALRSLESWPKLPSDKAATLSETFALNAGLPGEVVNELSPIIPSAVSLGGFLRL